MSREIDTRLGSEHRESLLDVLGTYWVAITAATVLCGMVGYGFSLLIAPEYVAQATLYLRDPSDEGVFDRVPALGSRTTRVFTEARQMTADATLEDAVSALEEEYGVISDLRRRLTVDPISDLNALRVTVTAGSPEAAVAYVEAITSAYRVRTAAERRAAAGTAAAELERYAGELDRQLNVAEDAIAELPGEDPRARALARERDALYAELIAARRTSQQLRVDADIAADPVFRTDPATEPASPARPRPDLNAGLAALVGLIATVALVSWYDEHGGPVHHPGKVRSLLDRPHLATLPATTLRPELIRSTSGRPGVRWSEATTVALQRLAVALVEFHGNTSRTRGRVLLVAHVEPTPRTAEAVLGAGLVTARSDRRVVLVDADLRTRQLARIATGTEGLSSTPPTSLIARPQPRTETAVAHSGLATVAAPPVPSTNGDATLTIPDDTGSKLRLFAVGRDGGDAFGFLASRRYVASIEELREVGDLVLVYVSTPFDSPETIAAARAVDGAILFVSDATSSSRLTEVQSVARSRDIDLLGYVYDDRSRSWGNVTDGWLERRREDSRPRDAVTLTAHRLDEEKLV